MPVIHALGTTLEVSLGDRIDEIVFLQAWSRCLSTSEPRMVSTGADDTLRVSGRESMTTLTQSVTRELIDRRAGELLMLHAGAVAHPATGRSVAYAAPGGTGKTTLTRLLGQRFGYVTDETVGVVPDTWEIVPYPKPLSFRAPGGGYPKTEVGPDVLGLLPAPSTPRLCALVILRRDVAVASPVWRRLDLFDAIMALAPETSSLSRLPRPLHMLADLHAELAGFWLVEYAQAAQIADRVGELIEDPT